MWWVCAVVQYRDTVLVAVIGGQPHCRGVVKAPH